jgi:hypothetical protein
MPSDPNIILGLNPVPPPPNPLATITQLSALKGQAIENQLRQQQIQTNAATQQNVQAEADQKNRDLADQNTIQQWLKDPANATALGSYDGTGAFPLAGKIQPKTQEALQTSLVAQQKAALANTGEQRTLNDKMHGQIGDTLNGILYDETGQKRSDADVARLAPPAFAQLVADKNIKPENVPTITSWDDGNAFAVKNRFVEGLNSYATKAQKAVQDIATAKATETMDTAHAAQFNADAAKLTQEKVTALANLPKVEADAAIAKADAAFRATHGGLSADETDKNKIARGQLGVSQAEQNIRQKTFDMTYGPNAPQTGLQGVRPNLVGPASAAMEKAGNELATAQGAADAMQNVLDLASKGNKAAGSNLPLLGVGALNAMNGIKRINGAEIAQYGSAGSLLDKIQGRIGSLTVGQPIPQDVLDSIRELHTTLAQQAPITYERKRQVTNQTYGSSFPSVNFTGTAAAGGLPPEAKAQLKAGTDTTFGNGQVWTLDANGQPKQIK